MAQPYTSVGHRLAVLLLLIYLVGQPALAAAQECVVDITAELQDQQRTDEGIRLIFAVELTSDEVCASATYDLILVELLPNGQWKSVRKTRRVELRPGKASDLVEHLMASDLKLLEHQARVVDCTPCPRVRQGGPSSIRRRSQTMPSANHTPNGETLTFTCAGAAPGRSSAWRRSAHGSPG
jgi:hypothetical protein